MLWFLIIPLCCSAAFPQIRNISVEQSDRPVRSNLTPNFSFEKLENSSPAGWVWSQRNTLWMNILERLPKWDLLPLVEVRKPDGSYVWGVEWLAAEYDGGIVVNLIQHGREDQEVVLMIDVKPFLGENLFAQSEVKGKINLKPLKPVFIKN